MENSMKSFEGIDKIVTLNDKKITLITHTKFAWWVWASLVALCIIGVGVPLIIGLLIYMYITNGREKSIYLKNIKSVEFNRPKMLSNGYMDFNTNDAIVANDENRVYFKKENEAEARELYDAIEDAINN